MMILIVDCETTGLAPTEGHAVVEVAAVPLVHQLDSQWSVAPGASSLVAPGRRVPPEAAAVHHLTDDMLRTAPKLPQALDQIIDQLDLREYPIFAIAAHNAEFDHSFIGAYVDVKLKALHSRLCATTMWGMAYGPCNCFKANTQWLCTWRCAQHLYPEATSHSNQALRYYLPGVDTQVRALTEKPTMWVVKSHKLEATDVSIKPGPVTYMRQANIEIAPLHNEPTMAPHRALYDAYTTACILKRMLETHTLTDLVEIQGQPVLQRLIRFGKHRGVPWADAPKDYLRWVTSPGRVPPFAPDVVYTARYYLDN